MLEIVGKIRAGKTPVYQMIRDIVCDSRFYCVVEDDLFWKKYATADLRHFIDSLSYNSQNFLFPDNFSFIYRLAPLFSIKSVSFK